MTEMSPSQRTLAVAAGEQADGMEARPLGPGQIRQQLTSDGEIAP